MKAELRSIGISLGITALVWVLIYAAFALHVIPKRLYEEQKEIADTVPGLRAEIEYRKHNLDVEGPAFGNIMDTINVFRPYRATIGQDAVCEIRITSPDNSNIARQMASLARAGSSCLVSGPVDTSGDPEWRRATSEEAVLGAIRLNTARDVPGADQLFRRLRSYVQVERDYRTFPGASAHVIWLQFGQGVRWNTELR